MFAVAAPALFVATALFRNSGPPHKLVRPEMAGSFDFGISKDGAPRHIRVWFQAPEHELRSAPILFVMTGRQRNAREYRDQWRRFAQQYGVLVVVPEISDELFPGASYNLGNMVDSSKEPVPTDESAFNVIEPLFDAVVADIGSTADRYDLYGHSAGAQFVHRFVMFQQPNRVAKAVAANAGWYTALDEQAAFPYGLRDSPATAASISSALATPLVILLGEHDNDPTTDGLRTTPGAMAQGDHRLARGKFFFASATLAADRLQVPLAWRVLIVPDAEHSNEQMAAAAAGLLFD